MNLDIELRAEKTLFFLDSPSGAIHTHLPRVDYKYILRGNLDVPASQVRSIIRGARREDVERDVGFLLESINWRHQFIACAAIASGVWTPGICARLWVALIRHSWAAPQLAAVVSVYDPAFLRRSMVLERALRLPIKTLVSLSALMTERKGLSLPAEVMQKITRAGEPEWNAWRHLSLTWADRLETWPCTGGC